MTLQVLLYPAHCLYCLTRRIFCKVEGLEIYFFISSLILEGREDHFSCRIAAPSTHADPRTLAELLQAVLLLTSVVCRPYGTILSKEGLDFVDQLTKRILALATGKIG